MQLNRKNIEEFIENNLEKELTTEYIASNFNLSATHFKRLFRQQFDITVSDYVRKRRMIQIAFLIRKGKDYRRAAAKYGYHSHAGIMRAFVKEYLVTPSAYKKAHIEDILLEEKDIFCGKIEWGIFDIRPLLLETSVVLQARYFEDEKSADAYWRKNGYPAAPACRMECNREIRGDEAALWYHDASMTGFHYVTGPIVKEFSTSNDSNQILIEIPLGKYAIFQTNTVSDEKQIVEVRKLFRKYIFYQWMKDNRNRIDENGIVFERFVNRKVYLYIPVKNEYIV